MPSAKIDDEVRYLEVSKEIVDALSVGEEVTVKMRGTVTALESRETKDYALLDAGEVTSEDDLPTKQRHELSFKVDRMAVYPDNEFSNLATDEDEY